MVCGSMIGLLFELSERPTVFDVNCIGYMEELSNIIDVEKDDLIDGELRQECSLNIARKSRIESWPVQFLKSLFTLFLRSAQLTDFPLIMSPKTFRKAVVKTRLKEE